jgi:hypothetical protein
MSEKPTFIITAGPTGSGKSSLITETKKSIGKSNIEFTKILIDDLVENNDFYKTQVTQIIKTKCENPDDTCLQTTFDNPTPELFKQFSNAYFETRSATNDNSHCIKDDNSKINCNELNDTRLKDSLTAKKNIVLETTGQYIPAWVLNTENWISEDYEVVFSYSLVNIDNLVNRNKSRAFNSVKEFVTNPANPAPRLPDVSKEVFIQNVKRMRENLIDLYNSCIKVTLDEKKCGNKKINRLLIFDNNEQMKQIFDSNTTNLDEEAFNKIIDGAIGSLDAVAPPAATPVATQAAPQQAAPQQAAPQQAAPQQAAPQAAGKRKTIGKKRKTKRYNKRKNMKNSKKK